MEFIHHPTCQVCSQTMSSRDLACYGKLCEDCWVDSGYTGTKRGYIPWGHRMKANKGWYEIDYPPNTWR